MATSYRLHFTVWQFVRLCVRLEDEAGAANGAGLRGAPELLKAWGDIWTEIDGQLTRLARDDFPAYGEMMMAHEVVIEELEAGQLKTCIALLDAVIADMGAALKQGGDRELIENLTFEIGELSELKASLERMAA